MTHDTEKSAIALPEALVDAGALPWEPHPAFPGVAMKHLVLGRDTGGGLSCHLVRVDPGAVLPEHDHPGNTELHRVLDGSGACRSGCMDIDYVPGAMAVIPPGRRHSVAAGVRGLTLLAQFCPALK